MALESRQPGATVVPLLISSDKTQLTVFRGKTAYPIYMGIGNIPKDIRRKPSRSAQMLIGYIPTSKLEGMTNKAARRRALANMFHSCMEKVLNPIRSCGETGLVIMCGDGTWRRCHPIFATFVGDYPEQTLVSCTYSGRCPKCSVPHDQLGEYNFFPRRSYAVAIDTYFLADEDVQGFHPACRAAGLKPVYHPFWQFLPLTDIFLAITPDILHQLLQGVIKHLVAWLTHPDLFGVTNVNARCWSLPPNHHITLFMKGLPFSRVTGKEHKDICRILIGLITDLPILGGHSPVRVVRAVRAILDFVYLAQYPSHTTDTLNLLEHSLTQFHDNKDTFIALGVRENFLIPKIHSMLHYKSSITLFGTTDNYNTEQSERLHIDMAKNAYRASNRKDEYPQMTAWLERREKMHTHAAFIRWRQHNDRAPTRDLVPMAPPKAQLRHHKMTKHPTLKAVSFETLAEQYGASEFQDALADYIARINHPGASAATLRARASDTLIPFRTVPVFHRIKFTSASNISEIVDSVVIRPEQIDTRGRIVPPRFDTVLVRGTHQDVMHGNNGESYHI
jgi:Plavaka transposase